MHTSKHNLSRSTDLLQQMTKLGPTEKYAALLTHRQSLTDRLSTGPLDPVVVLERAKTYQLLEYADLAAADAYVAITLAENAEQPEGEDLLPECEVFNDEGEKMRVSWPADGNEGMSRVVKRQAMGMIVDCLAVLGCLRDAWEFWVRLRELMEDVSEDEGYVSRQEGDIERKVRSLDGYLDSKPDLNQLYDVIAAQYRCLASNMNTGWDGKLEAIATRLPRNGFARREIYPWNDHESDRTSPETLKVLNKRLEDAAPNLEVRACVLPDLGLKTKIEQERKDMNGNASEETSSPEEIQANMLQLGLFAKANLTPGTVCLREKSLLTAIRDTHASLCDACAAPLPKLDAAEPPVACEECDTAVFCSQSCREAAMGRLGYHRRPSDPGLNVVPDSQAGEDDDNEHLHEDAPRWPFCNNEYGLDDIGRDPLSTTPADDLYFLLLTRAIAMAELRGVHPLDFEDTKYLCGEFEKPQPDSPRTLPFTLRHNIILPLTYFTTLLLSDPKYIPYSPHWLAKYDFWTIQTLSAKFRGVASARQSTWDGKPEVAVVHWRWSLANHSCNPGVEWTWEAGTLAAGSDDGKGNVEEGERARNGEIVFRVRRNCVWRRPDARQVLKDGEAASEDRTDEAWDGIRAGDEMLSHYCDIDLPVSERQAWARGPLGGDCRCERCLWESDESRT